MSARALLRLRRDRAALVAQLLFDRAGQLAESAALDLGSLACGDAPPAERELRWARAQARAFRAMRRRRAARRLELFAKEIAKSLEQ